MINKLPSNLDAGIRYPVSIVDNHIYKSWKSSSNLYSATFNQINIIFGHNGSGKSSLAVGIAKKYLTDNDKSTTRFFSTKYVESTLLLEDRSGIRGVVSNFGVKDVNIEKQISLNSKIIGTIKADLVNQTISRKRIADDTDKLVKEIVKRRKDKNKKINNKPENKTINETVLLWVKDYDDAFKMLPKEDYNTITGNTDFSAESEALNVINIPSRPVIDENFVSTLKKLLDIRYKSIDIPAHEVVNWLQSGLHIHKDKTFCEFCGSSIDIN
jgi:wobble nucleotide-excising tRNase